MTEWTSNPQFEENVRRAFGLPQIRPEFVDQLYADLMQRAVSRSRKPRLLFGLRPAWTVALVILLTTIIGTLVIGPQCVYAEFLKLFGYIPGVGNRGPEQCHSGVSRTGQCHTRWDHRFCLIRQS